MEDFMDVEERGAVDAATLEVEFHDALGSFESGLRQVEDEEKHGGDGEVRHDLEKHLLKSLEDICTARSRSYHMTDATREASLYAEAVTWKLLCLRRMDLDWSEHEIVPAKELVERSAHEVMLELEKDREFRRLDCIVLWLELQQQEVIDYFQDEIDEGAVSMWPATRAWVDDGDERWPRSRSLDPDAPYGSETARDGRVKRLHPVDESDDCKLLERVWRYIRAGQADAASELCRRCGQSWRAASISGGEPWTVIADSDNRLRRFNNVRPLQWLQMCHKMARTLKEVEDKQKRREPRHRDSVVHWEWTLYAALAGCPELLTESDKCKTWEDQCWAYFHAKRECYLMSKLRSVQEEKRPDSELYPDLVPSDVGSAPPITAADKLSIEEVFRKIERLAGTLAPERRVQASIIKQELKQVVVELMDSAGVQGLGGASWERKSQLLRLLAHLGIYVQVALRPHEFEAALSPTQRAKVHELVEAYMDHLMTQPAHVKLTALYASYLPLPARHDKFTRCMTAVSKTEDRRACLEECTAYLAPVLDIIINDILEHSRTTPIVLSSQQTPEVQREADSFRQLVVQGDQRAEALCRRLPAPELLWIKALEWCHLPHLRTVSDYTMVHANAYLRELIIRSAQSSRHEEGGALISDAFRLLAAYSTRLLGLTRHEALQLPSHEQEWEYWQSYTRAQEAFLSWSSSLAELHSSLDELEKLSREGRVPGELEASISATEHLRRVSDRVEQVWRRMQSASAELLANLNPDHGVWMDVRPSGLEAGQGGVAATEDPVLRHLFHEDRVRRRNEELRRLQATCIPEMVAMLDKVYFETARSIERAFVRTDAPQIQQGEGGSNMLARMRETAEECYMLSLKVAEVVAAPRWSIFQFFPKGVGQTGGSYLTEPFTLEDFMKRMERSSLALLGLNKSTNWADIMARITAKYPGR